MSLAPDAPAVVEPDQPQTGQALAKRFRTRLSQHRALLVERLLQVLRFLLRLRLVLVVPLVIQVHVRGRRRARTPSSQPANHPGEDVPADIADQR